MKSKSKYLNPLNVYLVEIRYKPNSKVLDFRGTWAEKISNLMNLPEWRIVENRIDIFDHQAKNRAFVGFKNAGFISQDVPTSNYFPEKATKFIKFILELDGFDSPIFTHRIGVRLKTYTPSDKSFEELRDRYLTRYLTITENAKEIMNGKLIDIGCPLNFADKYGNFNTMSGPMPSEQARQFLERSGEIPEKGLYFDIDYWIKPEKKVNNQVILKHISTFAKETWNKQEKLHDLILSD